MNTREDKVAWKLVWQSAGGHHASCGPHYTGTRLHDQPASLTWRTPAILRGRNAGKQIVARPDNQNTKMSDNPPKRKKNFLNCDLQLVLDNKTLPGRLWQQRQDRHWAVLGKLESWREWPVLSAGWAQDEECMCRRHYEERLQTTAT